MFADDITNCADTWIRLQFCQLTKMTVNMNKTEIIVFPNGGPLRSYVSWTFNGLPVKTTSEYKYMDLIFTPKVSRSKAKRKLAFQSREAIFCIKTYQKIFFFNRMKDSVFFILRENRFFAMCLRSGTLNIQTLYNLFISISVNIFYELTTQ